MAAIKRRDEGRCNLGPEFSKIVQRKLVEEGKHHMLGGELQRKVARKRLNEGTHNITETIKCPHCSKTGQLVAMKRWHFDNCKLKGFK